jgi:hypothetical protein
MLRWNASLVRTTVPSSGDTCLTTQNFIDELQEVSAQFTWTLEPDTGIYASLRRWPRLHVRGVSKVGPEAGIVFEPMGALCYARTGPIRSDCSRRTPQIFMRLPTIAPGPEKKASGSLSSICKCCGRVYSSRSDCRFRRRRHSASRLPTLRLDSRNNRACVYP